MAVEDPSDALAVWSVRAVGEDAVVGDLENDRPIGRLLEELSWEGNAVKYRKGGRGLENVLVTEVFQALELLPRTAFLARVLRTARGDSAAIEAAAAGVEEASVVVLPEGVELAEGGPEVQPDVLLQMPTATVVIEAKKIRPGGSFQPEQLAREYLVLQRNFGSGTRLLLLLLPGPPPIAVRGRGRISVREAVLEQLGVVHARADASPPLSSLVTDVDKVLAWTTWADVDRALLEGLSEFAGLSQSVASSITRGVSAARRAIAWHS